MYIILLIIGTSLLFGIIFGWKAAWLNWNTYNKISPFVEKPSIDKIIIYIFFSFIIELCLISFGFLFGYVFFYIINKLYY